MPQIGTNQLYINYSLEDENTKALSQQKKNVKNPQQEGKVPKRRSSQILSPWFDRFNKIKNQQMNDDEHKEAPKQQELIDDESKEAMDKKEIKDVENEEVTDKKETKDKSH